MTPSKARKQAEADRRREVKEQRKAQINAIEDKRGGMEAQKVCRQTTTWLSSSANQSLNAIARRLHETILLLVGSNGIIPALCGHQGSFDRNISLIDNRLIRNLNLIRKTVILLSPRCSMLNRPKRM